MKSRRSQQNTEKTFALVLSVCLHTLLLLGAYYLPLKQQTGSTSGYRIILHPVGSPQESTDIMSNAPPSSTIETQNKPAAQAIIERTNVAPLPKSASAKEKIVDSVVVKPQEDTNTTQIKKSTNSLPKGATTINQTETIDERGLYKTNQEKATEALLELEGWIWDTAPQPQDNTDIYGKIVFQITVDEFGEVIAVKTLEKTISPLVEQIYREALTCLSFSKTTDHVLYPSTTTGKVTFMLQAK
mmetsp:Transcript_1081/g.2694  ORF Transcript_1081/g.2694 Transcript_1081/m.2694 type:complete len:243 (-) Transcript_1081:608-1336(-)